MLHFTDKQTQFSLQSATIYYGNFLEPPLSLSSLVHAWNERGEKHKWITLLYLYSYGKDLFEWWIGYGLPNIISIILFNLIRAHFNCARRIYSRVRDSSTTYLISFIVVAIDCFNSINSPLYACMPINNTLTSSLVISFSHEKSYPPLYFSPQTTSILILIYLHFFLKYINKFPKHCSLFCNK